MVNCCALDISSMNALGVQGIVNLMIRIVYLAKAILTVLFSLPENMMLLIPPYTRMEINSNCFCGVVLYSYLLSNIFCFPA